MESEELRVTTSLKIKPSIRDKFKVYCIEKKIDMSELLEKLMIKELIKGGKNESTKKGMENS